jgi:hypothetical protein
MRPLLADTIDREPVELELATDLRRESQSTGAQLFERHWLLASVPQSLAHPQLLSFNERHQPDPSPHSPVAIITAFLTPLPRPPALQRAPVNRPSRPSGPQALCLPGRLITLGALGALGGVGRRAGSCLAGELAAASGLDYVAALGEL